MLRVDRRPVFASTSLATNCSRSPPSRARYSTPSPTPTIWGEIQLLCYALEEVMSEKVRAVLGQRIYAVSRDLYDIFSLMEYVDERKVQVSLPRKLEAREVDLEAIHRRRIAARKEEFRADWERNLAALLSPGPEREFDEVWDRVAQYVRRISKGLPDMRGGDRSGMGRSAGG